MATFYRADGWVKSTLGPAVSGAQIYVCTQPANTVWPIDPVTRKPIPNWQPTPQAAIYADVNGLQAIQQPIFTDGFGHYNWYALTGSYTVVVINNGAVQQVYPDQSLGLFGLVIPPSGNVSGSNLVSNTIILGGGGTSIVSGPLLTGDTTKFLNGAGVFSVPPAPAGLALQTNETPNGSQTLLDLHAGTGISLVDNGAGRVTVSASTSTTAPFFWSNGSFYINTTVNLLDCGGAGNDVLLVLEIFLPVPCTVNKVTYVQRTNDGASNASFAIYSLAGALLLDSGSSTFSNGNGNAVTITLGSPVTLSAGAYYFAWAGSSSGFGAYVTSWAASDYDSTLPYSMKMYTANANRFKKATNPRVAGVMPATLGTLLAQTTNAAPAVFFEA